MCVIHAYLFLILLCCLCLVHYTYTCIFLCMYMKFVFVYQCLLNTYSDCLLVAQPLWCYMVCIYSRYESTVISNACAIHEGKIINKLWPCCKENDVCVGTWLHIVEYDWRTSLCTEMERCQKSTDCPSQDPKSLDVWSLTFSTNSQIANMFSPSQSV